jgi:hypothetical protein
MNSGERPRHPDLLPHVTRRDSARQLVWGRLIDLPSATPVPEISGASPRAQPFISPRRPEGHGNWWGLIRHRLGHRSSWLDLNCPAEVYQPSTRAYQGLPDMTSLPRRPASSLIVAASVSATKSSTAAPYRLRRPDRRHQRSPRRHLAGQLYGL